MKVTVKISPTSVTSHEGAQISLIRDEKSFTDLYFDFTKILKAIQSPSDTTIDFLVVAAAIYSLDKLTARKDAEDGWKRNFELEIPVKNSAAWTASTRAANECANFLSGDNWSLSFVERTLPVIKRKQSKQRPRGKATRAIGETTCLFSGGLDSLAGAIDWLDSESPNRISLVGHHDPNIGGAAKDQKALLAELEKVYPERFQSILIGVGHSGKSPEITMRSRSILFIAMGMVVAAHLGSNTPLLIPENGTIALNVPLTPARRGSCSTRTAHPHYLKLLRNWLDGIGITNPILNPLSSKTKGEVISNCRNFDLLCICAPLSASCAKRGHTRWWVRRSARECGQCMPCIYRRASLHKVGLDTQVYGNDICNGEVDVDNPDYEGPDDLRACLSFLRHDYDTVAIAKMLAASAPMNSNDALAHAETVFRAMDEIRRLLSDKATPRIKKLAGLTAGRSDAN